MIKDHFEQYQIADASLDNALRGTLSIEDAIRDCMEYCSNRRMNNDKASKEDASIELISEISPQAYKEKTSNLIGEYLDTVQPLVCVIEENVSRELSRAELRNRLERELNEYGILTQGLIEDPEVDEVVVNSSRDILVQRHGSYYPYMDKHSGKRIVFDSPLAADILINRCLSFGNTSIKTSANGSVATASTPEGFRVTAIGQYAVVGEKGAMKDKFPRCGICVIRKHGSEPIPMTKLQSFNSIADEMARFLLLCSKYHLNVGVFGDLGSGKTTVLQSMVNQIDDDTRFAIIEKASEIRARHFDADGFMTNNALQLEYRDWNGDNVPIGANTLENIQAAILRLSMKLEVFGEVLKDSEYNAIKEAMSTMGVLFTGHARSPEDACFKFTDACLAASPGQTRESVMSAVCQALDIVVICSNMRDGTRKVTSIAEVVGTELRDGTIVPKINILYEYEQLGYDRIRNRVFGYHVQRNIITKALFKKLARTGVDFEDKAFLLDKSKILKADEEVSEATMLLYNGEVGRYVNHEDGYDEPAATAGEIREIMQGAATINLVESDITATEFNPDDLDFDLPESTVSESSFSSDLSSDEMTELSNLVDQFTSNNSNEGDE